MFTYGTYYQRKHSPAFTNIELLKGPPGPSGSYMVAKDNKFEGPTPVSEFRSLSSTVTELTKEVKQLTNLITVPINNAPKSKDTLYNEVFVLRNQVSNLTRVIETMTI